MRSLSEMFNVNYFLVSQTNPHIVPVLNLKKRVNRKLGNILEAEWKHRSARPGHAPCKLALVHQHGTWHLLPRGAAAAHCCLPRRNRGCVCQSESVADADMPCVVQSFSIYVVRMCYQCCQAF